MALFKKPVQSKPVPAAPASTPTQQAEEKRSGIDFAKLRDPEWQAKMRAEREAESALLEAKDHRARAAVRVCELAYEQLSADERSFVRKMRGETNSHGVLSEKQEAWLLDLAERFETGFKAAHPVHLEPKPRSSRMGL